MAMKSIKEMHEANQVFFDEVIYHGGEYRCPNTLNEFIIKDNKLISMSGQGREWVKIITSTEWFKSNVR